MLLLATIFLLANAVLHLVSFNILNKRGDANKRPVLIFALINALLAIFMSKGQSWAYFPALIFPMVGLLGLAFQMKNGADKSWVNLSILGLDVAIIGCVGSILFA